jgi:hypothetical protein
VSQVDDACVHLQQHTPLSFWGHDESQCFGSVSPETFLPAYQATRCHVGGLFYDAVFTETIVLDDKLIDERWIEKDLEGSSHSPIDILPSICVEGVRKTTINLSW